MSVPPAMPPQEPEIGAVLPRADEAVVAPEKLTHYALSFEHSPTGAAKARLFRALLGIERVDWQYLRDQLLAELPMRVVTTNRVSGPGGRWVTWGVPVWVRGLNDSGRWAQTGWTIRDGVPHLVTVYLTLGDSQDDPGDVR